MKDINPCSSGEHFIKAISPWACRYSLQCEMGGSPCHRYQLAVSAGMQSGLEGAKDKITPASLRSALLTCNIQRQSTLLQVNMVGSESNWKIKIGISLKGRINVLAKLFR